VQRVWDHTELGRWTELPKSAKKLPQLLHRTQPAAIPIELDNPAQPTRLRNEMAKEPVVTALHAFIRGALAGLGAQPSGRDFLKSIRDRAYQQGFPVSQLLTVRAGVNCARPLARPGHLEATSPESLAAAAAAVDRRGSGLLPSPEPVKPSAASSAPASAAAAATPPTTTERSRPKRAAADNAGAAMRSTIALDDDLPPPKPARSRRVKGGASPVPPVTPSSTVKSSSSPPASRRPPSLNLRLESSESEEDEAPMAKSNDKRLQEAIKALFLELCDERTDEIDAPLAGTVWNNWMQSGRKYKANLQGEALTAALMTWKLEVFRSLKDGELDDQLYAFLTDHARQQTPAPQVAARLAKSKGKGSWRSGYSQHNRCASHVQLLWAFYLGVQPKRGDGSVLSMNWSGVCMVRRLHSRSKARWRTTARQLHLLVPSRHRPKSQASEERRHLQLSPRSVRRLRQSKQLARTVPRGAQARRRNLMAR
jgi:hypothetical protein